MTWRPWRPWRPIVCVTCLMTSALHTITLLAQPPTSATSLDPAVRARLDTALVQTATVGDLLRAARVGDSAAATATDFAAAHVLLSRMLSRLERPAIAHIRLEVIAESRFGFRTVLRKQEVTSLTVLEAASLDTLAIVMEQELPDALSARVGRDSVTMLLAPLDAFNIARRRQSLMDSREKLFRFERKYGPNAPPRNLAEVAANFAAQWIPAFQPSAEGWPSRLELIASYVPTYVSGSLSEHTLHAVTALEVGVRIYSWRADWGGAQGGALRPAYWSLGTVVAGERNGAFTSPLAGTSRFGAFFGWGDNKIAVIGGRAPQLLFARQVHLVPWAF